MVPEEVRVVKPGLPAPIADVQRLFVVAFDPGVTTGWFVARVSVEDLMSGGLRGVAVRSPDPDVFAWDAGAFTGPEPWMAERMMAIVRGTWMHGFGEFDNGVDSDLFLVVGEDWRQRLMGDDETVLAPVRIQAAFRQLSWRAPFPFVLANIGDAMKVFTDERLRNFNLWSGPDGTRGEHQRDATRYGSLIIRSCSQMRWLDNVSSRMPWLRE